jgi:cyanophycin synthetase
MKLHSERVLRGPNIWALCPLLEVTVDDDDLSRVFSNDPQEILGRLRCWLPGIEIPSESCHRIADLLAIVALELQRLAGVRVTVAKAIPGSSSSNQRILLEYENIETGREALSIAHKMIEAVATGDTLDFASEFERLHSLELDVRFGPSTAAIVAAAVKRGIPYRRLNAGSLVRFGYGKHQRYILATETSKTGVIAEMIAQDKELTRLLLSSVGVPVPVGRPVASAEDAWQAALKIGGPVVVKPQFGNHGRGVTTCIHTREQVRAAYEIARREGESIIVESFAPGGDYRILVVNGKVVAAAHREPPMVVGDGCSTVRELVEAINCDPRRSDGHATVLTKIALCEIAQAVLQEAGFTPDSIPAAGLKVLLRRSCNLSTGGEATDVTDLLHPQIVERAVDAARVIGLDVAGIDVIVEDIRLPLECQGGIVCEVNAAPGLRMHLAPSRGTARAVGEAILDSLIPVGETARIPIVAITGVNGKTTTTRLIAHTLKTAGHRVGMTSTDGIFSNGKRIDTGDCSGPISAQAVLGNPHIDAAVLETARGGILRAGLGFDRCDVAVVTNIGEGDHLGLAGIETPEQLASVKSTIVKAVSQNGAAVLNADDPLVVEMASHCPGSVIFFAMDADQPVLERHLQTGGRGVFIANHEIVLRTGSDSFALLSLGNVPLTHAGRVGFQIENVLAATAACWALGIPLATIRKSLESFSPTLASVPGRFNLLSINGATVVFDYGHNPSSLIALLKVLDRFPHKRRVCIYSAAGDRRDCDLVRQGELLGEAFDRVIIYEDRYLRGRTPGTITALFRQGLSRAWRNADILTVERWAAALEQELQELKQGDLLLVQADVIDDTVAFLRDFQASNPNCQEITLEEVLRTFTPTLPDRASIEASISISLPIGSSA